MKLFRCSIFAMAAIGAFTASSADAQQPKKASSPKNVDAKPSKKIDVKVLVLNFDPIVKKKPLVRLHQEMRWQNPRELVKGYIEDVKKVSGGLIRYRVVDWKDIDDIPTKADGFDYSLEEYVRMLRAGKGMHQPDLADYPKLIAEHKVVPRVEKGEIDEVFLFGGPWFGYYEASMAGKGAFYINGGVYGPDVVPCKRAFAIMGFNYERGVAEMLHDLCHRTESTMSRIYGGWKIDQLDTDWARFAANHKQSNGVAAVGTCHYPPNAESDYDYGNQRFVDSSADDWLNYPELKGMKRKLNCEAWGGPDYQRNYMKWWFAHLPRVAGKNKETHRLNNWWEYVFNFNSYDDRGRAALPYDTPEYLTAERRRANLLRNSSFETASAEQWSATSWRQNPNAIAIVSDAVKEGKKSIVIRSPEADDARFMQKVSVKPKTRHLLSGWIKTQDVAVVEKNGKTGANLSIDGGYELTTSLAGTKEWEYVALIFDTGDRTAVTVCARLGFYSSTTKGTAWFDDLCLIELQ